MPWVVARSTLSGREALPGRGLQKRMPTTEYVEPSGRSSPARHRVLF